MTNQEDPAAGVIARAQSIVEDLTFAEVTRWKREHTGALAVGYMPVYVPRPLFEAIGCLPVAVFGGGDRTDIIRGDSYFQSYICHIPRSTIELALSGALAPLDGMIFPSTCDVIRNLGGMWKMLFPERYGAYLDLPQNLTPALGGRFYAEELRRIARELEARGARPLDAAALREAIAAENARRRLIDELDELRRSKPWLLRASEAYVAVRAGSVLPVSEHVALLGELLAALERRDVRAYDNVRVVITGAFCEQPPLGLIRTLEKSGCDIVDDDLQLGLRMIEQPITVDADSDPLVALAEAFLKDGAATACRYIDKAIKGEALIAKVRAANADGVIFTAASFCDPALLDQPMLERALTSAKIPFTSFKFAENTGQYQTIREQAGAFSDSVKLWGGTP